MYRGIVLWPPSHTLSSVKNTVQILPFRAMNLLGKENESWLLLFRLPPSHNTCPGFLSGSNTWAPQAFLALTQTFHVFTRVPAHRQVLEQLHLPSPWAPRHHTGYYLLSFIGGLEPANVSSQEQHHSCDQVLPTETLQRKVFITPLSLFTVTGFSFAWLVGFSNYRIKRCFLKSPQSKTWIFNLSALLSAREVFSSWKV